MSLVVRGLEIGSGVPKICLPLMGRTEAELISAADEGIALMPDLAELRADYYSEPGLLDILIKLREKLPFPILFTLRDAAEGGAARLDAKTRFDIYNEALRSGAVDMIDIELASEYLSPLISDAKNHGIAVVLSAHFFESTPSEAVMTELLYEMRERGADIAKLAVTPKSPAEVLSLLSVTERCRGAIPLITISMGGLGLASRVIGGLFGSVITFGCGSKPSAPGQMPVNELRLALKPYY